MKEETFSKLKDHEKIGLNAEFSALEEGIAENNRLKEMLDDSCKAISASAMDILDSMMAAHDQKKESVAEIRSWRKTLESESGFASLAIKSLLSEIKPEKLAALKEFVDLMERLSKVPSSPLLSRVMGDS